MRVGSCGHEDASRNEGFEGRGVYGITLASGHIAARVVEIAIVLCDGEREIAVSEEIIHSISDVIMRVHGLTAKFQNKR
jgi:O-phosphoseryl-tRNA(Cys) synthetase